MMMEEGKLGDGDDIEGKVGGGSGDLNCGNGRTILEQVGEYLSEQGRQGVRRGGGKQERDGGGRGVMGRDGDGSEGEGGEGAHGWSAEEMQIDLERLGHSLLEGGGMVVEMREWGVLQAIFLDFSLLEETHHGKLEDDLEVHHHSKIAVAKRGGEGRRGDDHEEGGHEEGEEDDKQGQEQQPQHVRPRMVFSPMMSPLVQSHGSATNTPMLSADLAHTTHNTPYLQHEVHGIGMHALAKQSSFSPLSSPALMAVEGVRSNSFSLPEASLVTRRSSGASRSKKTPHSTPYMSAGSGKVSKHSPLVGPKKTIANTGSAAVTAAATSSSSSSSKYKGQIWDDMFKLPNSSIAIPSSQQYSTSLGSVSGDTPTSHSTVSSTSLGPADDHFSDEHMKPATLMNFPKFILPSVTNNHTTSSSSPSNGMVIRATESPVIRPRHQNGVPTNSAATVNNKGKNINNNKGADNSSTGAAVSVPPTAVSIPDSLHMKNIPNGSSEHNVPVESQHHTKRTSRSASNRSNNDELIKKEVHKVAEQGRRNRLNNALVELNTLLPQELKDSVQVPSKATTVEMACEYIKQLTSQKK
ncbi:phosphate-sensing transcription factor PHO4 Ecym_4385 [Eremothecium cymbalariae DBVPG|uniref:BHLH domain-containing protein n=1 Tax=Eremothecium cymbalariae (strain CBS 270.75 / DBVPG 7215 / KCTC 17166 / NRRL Y-17582) TaxID=931890 RepID=G8JTT7_ERECY|nr:hypothetical protein Ecym_4385 [Eremothecium cymbalariae DBVPG\